MKRTFLILILIATTNWALIATEIEVNGLYFNVYPNTAKVIHPPGYLYKDYTGNIIIPETITYNGLTYTVDSIADYSFCPTAGNPTGITSVTMPNTITNMGVAVFRECSLLTSVTLSTSLAILPDYTFDGCAALQQLELPASVITIRRFAFGYTNYTVTVNKRFTLTCKSATPPTLITTVVGGNNAAEGLNRLGYTPGAIIKINVPNESYKTATNWSKLAPYMTVINTAVETPTESNFLIKTSDNSVKISNVYGKSIKAFDLSGRIVFETRKAQETEEFIVYNKGIYILSIDNFMKKIAIY